MRTLTKQLCPLLFFFFFTSANAADVWVSPAGSDRNPGTKEQPMATLTMALRRARELRRLKDPSVKSGARIIIKAGTYHLYEPIFIRPEDSGTEESPTVIEAVEGEKPVLSGGMTIDGWRKAPSKINGLPATAQGKVWVADAPKMAGRLLEFRQLWVNDQKAVRAKEVDDANLQRILGWDTAKQEAWIPAPAAATLKNAAQLEMVLHQMWAIAILRVKSLDVMGDRAKVTFHQPENRIQFEHPWPPPVINGKNGNSAFYLTNALQLLDEPGEWYLDMDHAKIYYWPQAGEDMLKAEVVAPVLETLVNVSGTPDLPVSHIYFKGIGFEHTTWLRPSREGHVALQAGMYLIDAYKLLVPGTPDKKSLENQAWIGRQPAGVQLSYVSNTRFEKCRFRHMAATGLDYIRGSNHDTIEGCLFKDIGGTGIQVGTYSDPAFETHLPFNPADERELCRNTKIANNLVTDCANDDWGCVGISAGYVQGINIEHNEVSDVSYSAICVGWGWTRTVNSMRNNRIHANHIHHYAKHMYDVAGVYTLSAQPGSEISENSVHTILQPPYAHDPNHWFYLYLDEGSSYITVKNNWCPAEKFMKNANGPGNVWENNGPNVSESIKKAAGLQPAFQYLLSEK